VVFVEETRYYIILAAYSQLLRYLTWKNSWKIRKCNERGVMALDCAILKTYIIVAELLYSSNNHLKFPTAFHTRISSIRQNAEWQQELTDVSNIGQRVSISSWVRNFLRFFGWSWRFWVWRRNIVVRFPLTVTSAWKRLLMPSY